MQTVSHLQLKKTIREQSDFKWFEERKNRLTTSNFGRVLNRKLAPNEFFLKVCCSVKDKYPHLL